ncbi:MAG: hypothetical protein Q4C47_03860 [Planctomycetia bacterium]|nr:hypothetical protein [Planctomycetia bacterium]
MERNYNLPKNAKECFATRHVFGPGEAVHSVLIEETNGRYSRRDYTLAAWRRIFENDDSVVLPSVPDVIADPERMTKPDGIVGDWRTRIPDAAHRRQKWAPNDVLIRFFEELEDRPGESEMRYILALLLVRRRILVVEGEVSGDPDVPAEAGLRILLLRNVKPDQIYRVPVVVPSSSQRQDEIQRKLAELFAV